MMMLRSLLERPAMRAVKKHWLSLAFVLGFATDFVLLNQIDSVLDNLTLLFYVVLGTLSLLLFYAGIAQRLPERVSDWSLRRMPYIMQYAFGGLLSGMLIFYGRSGDFLASAPFFLLIIGVVIGNETIVKRSNRLLFHLALYFIGTFAYLVMVVPIVIGMMGDVIFVASGLLALLLIATVVKVLIRIIPNFVTMQIRAITFVIGSIYVLFNLFYFLNIIPPIPLSLTELAIYHSVERTPTGSYRVLTTNRPWWERLSWSPYAFHPVSGQGLACFARVYAPTSLTTDIYHHWEYYDEDSGRWKNHFRMSYHISGENKRGYGGYTEIKGIHDGLWRCTVETERGQVLGRYRFIVDTSVPPGELVTEIK